MTKFILSIYDTLKKYDIARKTLFCVLTLMFVFFILKLSYKEDISDFLPSGEKASQSLKIYQDITGADKLFIIFANKDTSKTDKDTIIQAIEYFTFLLKNKDTFNLSESLISQIDFQDFEQISNFVYSNIPYFLTKNDYLRIDSLFAQKDYIPLQLQKDKQMLLLPGSSMVSNHLQKDPLNLFSPILNLLQSFSSDINYELSDGYIFSPDEKRGIIITTTPFGTSETKANTILCNFITNIADSTQKVFPNIEINTLGGASIAVANSSQIKKDSILSIIIAGILICLILFLHFRNLKNIFLILISISWGWLFALSALSLINNNISIIVIGISSIILGIAVNYPLHLISHLNHTPNIKTTLKEITPPLLIGNITTVGAFLTLTPLSSVALRDLGLFAAFLLIGSIFFVLIFLPHILTTNVKKHTTFLSFLSNKQLEKSSWIVALIFVLTIVFAYFSQFTKFDSNMANINYMTDKQKENMTYFQKMLKTENEKDNIYVVCSASSLNEALIINSKLGAKLDFLKNNNLLEEYSNIEKFLPSLSEQKNRLNNWNEFISKHKTQIIASITKYSSLEGFTEDSFEDFYAILNKTYSPQNDLKTFFSPLLSSILSSSISIDSVNNTYNVVNILNVKKENRDKVYNFLEDNNNYFTFDTESVSSGMTRTLSNNFSFIGLACGSIVFLFLWFSFSSIELAILSFLPMAISWLWILGIMAIFNIHFNIVNIILATFIFGQGDDYTIFMTEGVIYEYTHRKKMLASYKNSILISALIMFVGIGCLIIAKHPALHSLAQVTIVGMFSVVLMAYIFPPFIFNWLTKNKNGYRKQPLSFKNLFYWLIGKLFHKERSAYSLVMDKYTYKTTLVRAEVRKRLKKYKNISLKNNADEVIIINAGYGEMALLWHFINPNSKITAVENDIEKQNVASFCSENLSSNIEFLTSIETDTILQLQKLKTLHILLLFPSNEDIEKYNIVSPIIIK